MSSSSILLLRYLTFTISFMCKQQSHEHARQTARYKRDTNSRCYHLNALNAGTSCGTPNGDTVDISYATGPPGPIRTGTLPATNVGFPSVGSHPNRGGCCGDQNGPGSRGAAPPGDAWPSCMARSLDKYCCLTCSVVSLSYASFGLSFVPVFPRFCPTTCLAGGLPR